MSPDFQKYRSKFTKRRVKRKNHFFWRGGLRDLAPSQTHSPVESTARPQPSLLDSCLPPREFQPDSRLCICMALYSLLRPTSLRHSDMACVNEGLHSLTVSPTRASTREISHTMPLFLAAEHHRTLAGTHFPSRRWSKAELACVAGYTRRWFVRPKTVTHPSTNRAQRTATWLMCLTPLPPRQTGTVY